MTQNNLESIALDNVADEAWKWLKQGVKISTHAFHTPVLTTVGDEYPESRVVVLRRVDVEQSLIECHTDLRSGKTEQINNNSAATWVFYDPSLKLQIRVRGTAVVHSDDGYAESRWQAMSDQSKRCYAQNLAAGEIVEQIVDAAPCPNVEDPEVGRKNFAIVSCRVDQLEWLYLNSAGHLRAISTKGSQKSPAQWSSQWIMP